MTLSSLWSEQRNQLDGKHVWQIITFAGDGKIRDGNSTSTEFRDFLSRIPTNRLKQYLDECLSHKFDDNGFVLQDIVNQIGRRLGFIVSDGRYRGSQTQIGYDGLWQFPDGHTVVVEVKMTDTYQINLETISKYRREIINEGKSSEDNSSILIVIGKEDRNTSDLEAQIRGSRFAWNIRLISVDALARLMSLKEEFEDPEIIRRISSILIPREFTKLDEIINLVFSTAEDVKEDDEFVDDDEEEIEEKVKVAPVNFHDACASRIEQHLSQSILKRSKSTYSSSDQTLHITLAISKVYKRSGYDGYWFAFHPYHKDFLSESQNGFVAFGCGSEETLLLIPKEDFLSWLDFLNVTERNNKTYWHVIIRKENSVLELHPKKGESRINLDKYLI